MFLNRIRNGRGRGGTKHKVNVQQMIFSAFFKGERNPEVCFKNIFFANKLRPIVGETHFRLL